MDKYHYAWQPGSGGSVWINDIRLTHSNIGSFRSLKKVFSHKWADLYVQKNILGFSPCKNKKTQVIVDIKDSNALKRDRNWKCLYNKVDWFDDTIAESIKSIKGE